VSWCRRRGLNDRGRDLDSGTTQWFGASILPFILSISLYTVICPRIAGAGVENGPKICSYINNANYFEGARCEIRTVEGVDSY
jgi:hypothetical protein